MRGTEKEMFEVCHLLVMKQVGCLVYDMVILFFPGKLNELIDL